MGVSRHNIHSGGVALAYQATERFCATPERLGILLYDGAISLCRQAISALDDGDVELAGDRLAKARQSVHQLRHSLRSADVTSDQQRFSDLYEQVHRRLVEADFYRRREAVSETISLLNCRRPAWSQFAQKLTEEPLKDHELAKSWIG